MTEQTIRACLKTECPSLKFFDVIDSTNTYLKHAAAEGAIHGSVVVADAQTAGRGRMGRTFQSPGKKGLYLSVLLRPELSAEVLMKSTGVAAVAAVRAIERVSGAKAGIKWTNDLVLNGRKLCGILAETVMMGESVALIIGVGINVYHARGDFEGEVADLATSLAAEGYYVERPQLAAALIEELYCLSDRMGGEIEDYLQEYRRRCVTIGKDVRLLWTEGQERAFAEDIDDTFGLVVRREDGEILTVKTGEVSVRGLYGYVE